MNQRRKIYLLLFALVMVGVSFTTNTFALDMGSSTVCGKDLNGDGFFAQDELKECVSGVCPIDTVQCDAQLSDPVCPAGGTLNTVRDMCQADSTNSCPTGYTYDQGIDRCTRPAECSDGGLFNPLTDRCEKLATDSCPDTYTLDAGNHLCWKTVDCGTGGTFNAAKDQCERALSPACSAGFAYNAANGKCEVDPTCSSGTYNVTYNKCLKPLASKTCPSGYSYVTARDRCEMVPTCASGTYNPATDKCENSSVNTYGANFEANGASILFGKGIEILNGNIRGYWFTGGGWIPILGNGIDNATGIAVETNNSSLRFGTTDSYGTLKWSTWMNLYSQSAAAILNNVGYMGHYSYRIEISSGAIRFTQTDYLGAWNYGAWLSINYTCNSGDTLSGTTCTHTTITQTSPTCPSGTMDYGNDVCYASYTPTCDPGLTYDATSGQCAVAATCAAPAVLDVATDKCTSNPSCPAGYSFNAVSKQCEAVPACAVGTYSTTYDKCLSDFTPTCPSGYSYVSSRGRCEKTPTCSSGTYNTATDKCEAGTVGTCSALAWDQKHFWVKKARYPSPTSAFLYWYVFVTKATCDLQFIGSQMIYETQCEQLTGTSRFLKEGAYLAGWYNNPAGYFMTVSPSFLNGNVGGFVTSYNGETLYTDTTGKINTLGRGSLLTPDYQCSLTGSSYVDLQSCINSCSATTQTSPTCPSGTMDYTNDVCYAAYTPSCAAGTTYDAASSKCAQTATCGSGGTLNTTTDLCVVSPASCNGWTFDAVNNICYSAPTCLSGIFNATTNLCNASIVPNCGTYTFNATAQKCTLDVTCPNLQPGFSTAGTIAFSPELDICVSTTQHDCPTSYAYNGQPIAKCEAVIVCPSGTYDPTNDKCRLGEYTCPLGNYACSDINGDGSQECSGFSCVNLATTPAAETPTDTTAYKNDGTVDPATGNCSGVFKIFNGHGGECMKPGWSTTFFNCCDESQGGFLIFKEFCPEENLTTVQAVIAQRTHYVGDYCKKKIPLIGCIQKAKMYCVFNSKLGRLIHEQGRPQLQKFAPSGNWGGAESPNCEGFTPEEFQTLDFSKIDLAEAFGDLNPASITNIQTNVNSSVGTYFNNIQK